MGNCLVTKLKGVVDNDNLQIFDAIVLQIHEVDSPSNDSQWFNFIKNGASPIEAEIVGDGHFIRGNSYAGGENVGKKITVTETSIGGSVYYYFSNGNYKVIIKGKYNINVITTAACIDEIDLNEFQYNNIIELNGRGCSRIIGNIDVLRNVPNFSLSYGVNLDGFYECYGTLEALMTPTRTGIAFATANPLNNGYGKLTGNISSIISSKDTITTINAVGNDGIYGDIAALGQCTYLASLYIFQGCSTYGTIESLIAAFRANGKTSGSITTQVYDNTGKCSVTFNGQRLPISYTTTVLTWTATTITCNGVTIDA